MKTDDLFQRISTLFNAQPGQPDHVQGWCDLEKAHALAAAVLTLRPKVCVEIGVFGGRSLLPVALALDAVGSGMIVGVDPWSAAASSEGYTGANLDWWSKLDHEQIYRTFASHVNRLGVAARVSIIRRKSDDVAPPPAIDMAHVDGQHTGQAVRDIQRFAPNIRLGGLCFVDDIDWANNGDTGVARGVSVLRDIGFVELYKIGTGAVFQRAR